MSVEAITWALAQPVQHSSTKFVLVALANCSDGRSFECYPSIAYLCDATAQNRKTVMENLKRLTDLGYIEDTGDRKGRTGQIKAYRLSVKTGPKTVPFEPTTVPESQSANDPEIGTLKASQNRNSTENGTVPKTELFNGPENGHVEGETVPLSDGKSTENGHERVPKTGHGTVSEPSVNPKEEAGGASATVPASPSVEKRKAPTITFSGFVKRRKEAGQQLIAADDPIFDWVEDAGIPTEWLRLVWTEFSNRHRDSAKRQADWPATFRNAVRGNWYGFWRITDGGQYALTTQGEMARRAAEAKARKAAQEAAA